MIFEIINPSDKYTLESDKWDVACLACMTLGQGKYSLTEEGGEHEMPMFLFGGLSEWLDEEFGQTVDEFMDGIDKMELVNCLYSVVVGDRADYTQGLGDKTGAEADAFWSEWHDRKRSSMNDMGQYARNYAAKLSEMLASGEVV